MKFKNFSKFLLSCIMAGALFTGCGGGDEPAKPDQTPEIELGMITHLNASEQKMEEIFNSMQDSIVIKNIRRITYYDNLNQMQMAIESGSVEQISLYQSVGNYIIAKKNNYEVVNDNAFNMYSDNFCFAVRGDDMQLKDDLDRAISEMNDDETLDKLVKEYITDVDAGKTPPAIEIPKTEGAPTIKVGVTGDLPPLDYVSADGKPAGFNTALLAEVAKRLNKNVEVVNVDSGARAAALSSKKIDVIFWVVVPTGRGIPANVDTPEDVELSAPYFADTVAHLKLKDSK